MDLLFLFSVFLKSLNMTCVQLLCISDFNSYQNNTKKFSFCFWTVADIMATVDIIVLSDSYEMISFLPQLVNFNHY